MVFSHSKASVASPDIAESRGDQSPRARGTVVATSLTERKGEQGMNEVRSGHDDGGRRHRTHEGHRWDFIIVLRSARMSQTSSNAATELQICRTHSPCHTSSKLHQLWSKSHSMMKATGHMPVSAPCSVASPAPNLRFRTSFTSLAGASRSVRDKQAESGHAGRG